MANPETVQQITALIEHWVRFEMLPNPSDDLAPILVIHKGGNGLMAIIQPMLNAQRQLGIAEGRTAERTEWRDWLARKNPAEAEGQSFDESPPDAA